LHHIEDSPDWKDLQPNAEEGVQKKDLSMPKGSKSGKTTYADAEHTHDRVNIIFIMLNNTEIMLSMDYKLSREK